MPANPDFVAPVKFSQEHLLGTLWAGVAISFCFLLFRFYVRLKLFRRPHIEDPFVLAAWLMNLAFAVLWQKNANKLYSVIAVESGQTSIPPPRFASCVNIELYSLFASYLLWFTALWSVKLSFLLFFRSLGNHIRRQMILWYCALGYTIASFATCLGMADYRCVVVKRGQAECASARANHESPTYLRVTTALDITTDVLLIVISTTLLWNASVELRKKLALAGIFGLTMFIIIFSIIRVILTTSGPQLDLTWLLLWSGLEMTVAIIIACVASFRILYTRSERSRRSVLNENLSSRAAASVSHGFSIPLEARLVHPASVATSEDTRHKRRPSTDTFEEAILPMHDVYPQYRHSVFDAPREYEEVRAALEAPVVRLHSRQLPLYTMSRDTAPYRFGQHK